MFTIISFGFIIYEQLNLQPIIKCDFWLPLTLIHTQPPSFGQKCLSLTGGFLFLFFFSFSFFKFKGNQAHAFKKPVPLPVPSSFYKEMSIFAWWYIPLKNSSTFGVQMSYIFQPWLMETLKYMLRVKHMFKSYWIQLDFRMCLNLSICLSASLHWGLAALPNNHLKPMGVFPLSLMDVGLGHDAVSEGRI